MAQKVRVGVAGMDHWYAAQAAVEQVAASGRGDLVAVAHRDPDVAREFVRRFSGAEVTQDYAAVAARPDVDLVITTGRTAGNAGLVIAAARTGKHVISVKPMAMTLEEADAMVRAVDQAGVLFYPLEAQYRLRGAYQTYRRYIDEGRIGRLLSALVVQRATLPTQDWPGREAPGGATWWLDPSQVPGGGWIDHAIYPIDGLRWLLGSEVASVAGVTAKLKYPRLELEDFGVGVLTFTNGFVATIEVTWHGGPASGYNLSQITGTDGQLVLDGTLSGRLMVGSTRNDPPGFALSRDDASSAVGAVEHMLTCIQEGKQPVASVRDGRQNLAACLAFYRAAREGRAVAVE